jgi:hypothetical protein
MVQLPSAHLINKDVGKRTVVLIAPWLKLKHSFLSSSHKFDTHIFHCAFD